jgi:hypothetical protein
MLMFGVTTEFSAPRVSSGIGWAKVQSLDKAIAPPIAKELTSPKCQHQLFQLCAISEFPLEKTAIK